MTILNESVVVIVIIIVSIVVAIAIIYLLFSIFSNANRGSPKIHKILTSSSLKKNNQISNLIISEKSSNKLDIGVSQDIESKITSTTEQSKTNEKDNISIETRELLIDSQKTPVSPQIETQASTNQISNASIIDISDIEEPRNRISKHLPDIRAKIEPGKRGGSPRGKRTSIENTKVNTFDNISPVSPKPEIVCWHREHRWNLAVEIPEKINNSKDLSVNQALEKLCQDEYRKQCYLINSLNDEIVIRWQESNAEQKYTSIPMQNNSLLFKLHGSNDEGRLVSNISYGWYILVAPDKWKIDTLTDYSRITPEITSITGYKANFIYAEKNSEKYINIINNEGTINQVIKKDIPFELIGNKPDIVIDNMPFFIQEPPSLRAEKQDIWKQINIIILGEEGHGINKWKTEFKPRPNNPIQKLPEELYNRNGGWYFLRFYQDDNLVDSVDFKFTTLLKGIKISPDNILPSTNGYGPTTITFEHKKECFIQLINPCLTENDYKKNEDSTVICLPPDPRYDITNWKISEANIHEVETSLVLKRIWWTLSDNDTEPLTWGSTSFELTKDGFKNKAIWIRVSQKRWLRRVKIGFQFNRAREYIVPVNENIIKVLLQEYSDSEELNKPCKTSLYLWFDNDKIITLAHLEVRIMCNKCLCYLDGELAIRNHIKGYHINQYSYSPSYEQIYPILKQRIQDLPQYIYYCGYCGEFFEDDESDRAQKKVIDHIERLCAKAKKGNPKFVPINDADKIRDIKKYKYLPYFIGCSLCEWMYDSKEKNPTQREQYFIDHLIQKHKAELYYLV
jgi:hypothetical protein